MIRIAAKLQTMLATQRERGATAVEYGLMVALIAAVIVIAVRTLGQTVLNAFTDTDSRINGGP